MQERRRSTRVTPPESMKAKLKTALTVRVVDISSSGAQVELSFSVPPRARCDLRLQADDGDILLKATVRRCRVFGRGEQEGQKVLLYRAGLEFESSSREVLELLGPKIPLLLEKTGSEGTGGEQGSRTVGKDAELTIEMVEEDGSKRKP